MEVFLEIDAIPFTLETSETDDRVSFVLGEVDGILDEPGALYLKRFRFRARF